MTNNCLGWRVSSNKHYWEDNGFFIHRTRQHYGCLLADVNNYPVYRKIVEQDEDNCQNSAIEVFKCDIGAVCHNYMVYLLNWNEAGWTGYEVIAAQQCSTTDMVNSFLQEYGFDKDSKGNSHLIK